MTDHQSDFNIKKPISVWNQEVSLNSKDFFSALGKCIANGVVLDYKGIAENAIDMVKAIGISDKGVEAVTWELINIALHRTILELVSENSEFITEVNNNINSDELSIILVRSIECKTVSINSDFFERPQELEVLNAFEQPLVDWLMCIGFPKEKAKSIYLRLKVRFVLNLHAEWGSDPAKYACIQERITSPFLPATQSAREWKQYQAWLQEEANKPVFSEVFGLREVYIELRGYYKNKCESDEDEGGDSKTSHQPSFERHVINVHSEIDRWVKNFNKEDAIKVISGGPGSGKSSIAKVLAADISLNCPDVSVLFVPLHHFDIDDNLISAVGNFIVGDRFLRTNPLDATNGQNRLLLIFDGLDELSMRGKAAEDSALAFVDEVITTINRSNDQQHMHQAIITGRDLSVQSSNNKLRKANQIIKLLPYYIPENSREKYIDPNNLLQLDQRDLWWKQYGKATGKPYESLPQDLNNDNLLPITKEPLLNYLVALTYEGGRIDFKNDVTLNAIYADLLQAVHQRQWDHGYHKGTCDLEKKNFERVLEEIALAVWHGHGRTASLSRIHKACEASGLTKHLDNFKEGSKKGVSRLLTAFYFRESDNCDHTFEFTHKSFGEYLISRRITRQVNVINNNIKQFDEDQDMGFNEQDALLKWVSVCGPTPLDIYIFKFLQNEISTHTDKIQEWQHTFTRLITSAINKNISMTQIRELSFPEMELYSNNAKEALFAIHHSCATQTKKVTTLKINQGTSLSNWIQNISRPSYSSNSEIMSSSLSYLNFSYINLMPSLFSNADFNGSQFNHSTLFNCAIIDSNAKYCNFNNSVMNGMLLDTTSFIYSTFTNAIFTNSQALYSCFSNCDFSNSSLHGTKFSGSHFFDANFSNAQFTEANLIHTKLNNANFTSANLAKSNFYDAELSMANLTDANLTGTNLTDANLTGANLTDANLTGANLTGANLTDANLTGANLTGANLTDANLTGANLTDTDMSKLNFDADTILPEEYKVYQH